MHINPISPPVGNALEQTFKDKVLALRTCLNDANAGKKGKMIHPFSDRANNCFDQSKAVWDGASAFKSGESKIKVIDAMDIFAGFNGRAELGLGVGVKWGLQLTLSNSGESGSANESYKVFMAIINMYSVAAGAGAEIKCVIINFCKSATGKGSNLFDTIIGKVGTPVKLGAWEFTHGGSASASASF